MPVAVTLADSGWAVIRPTEAWRTTALRLSDRSAFKVDPDYYVVVRDVGSGPAAGR